MRRFSLIAFVGAVSCSADTFRSAAPDAQPGADGSPDGGPGGICSQKHALCDDFEAPNLKPAQSPPWTKGVGLLQLGSGFMSQRGLEAKATTTPGSYAVWALTNPNAALECQAKVQLDDAADRMRSIFFFQVDVPSEGGILTYGFLINVDAKSTTGIAVGPGVLANWASSNIVVPTKAWHAFKFTATPMGAKLGLAATIGPVQLTGVVDRGTWSSASAGFGASTLGAAADVVRWDDVFCDLK